MNNGNRKRMLSGDYKEQEGGVLVGNATAAATTQKLLVNIGPERKQWLERVADALDEGTVTEVMRTLIDQESADTSPEAFAVKVEKWRLKAQLDDIARRKREVLEDEARLLKALGTSPTPTT